MPFLSGLPERHETHQSLAVADGIDGAAHQNQHDLSKASDDSAAGHEVVSFVRLSLSDTRRMVHGHGQASTNGASGERNGEKGAQRLPPEIMARIFAFALRAVDGEFRFPCYSELEPFQPHVNLNCLLLNKDLYHFAREALFTQNRFIFSGFGCDIKDIIRPLGLAHCRWLGCSTAGDRVTLREVTFILGRQHDAHESLIQIEAFQNSLQWLRSPLQVKHLRIVLMPYSFRTNDDVHRFCRSLRNVKVHGKLTLIGLDVHLELRLRILPALLNMQVQPTSYESKFRDEGGISLGYFQAIYERSHAESGALDSKAFRNYDQDPENDPYDDPVSKYREWKRTASDLAINNGKDYVWISISNSNPFQSTEVEAAH